MLKRNVTLVLLLLLVPCFLLGQAKKVTQTHTVIITDQQDFAPQVYNKSVKLPKPTAVVGEQIGVTTNYDYFTNCITRDQIVYWQGVKFANMVKPYGTAAATVRHIVYTERDSSTGVYTHADVFGGQAGFGDIDVERVGANAGQVGVVGHTPNRLGLWDGSAFQVATFAPGDDPSIQFGNTNIWLSTSGNGGRDQYQFYKSPDGVSFTDWDSISVFSPSPIFWAANGSTELGISKSPDETQVVYYSTAAGDPTRATTGNLRDAFDGVPLDSCDNFFTVTSTNSGTSWTGNKIEIDGVKGSITTLPHFAPVMSAFGQVDLAVTNTGVIHAVANGFGYNFNPPDTTYLFPVLYYNSGTGKWISISDPTLDTNQILNQTATATVPGVAQNRVGQAYPSVAVSEDGKFVYVCWTSVQFTNGKPDTATDGTVINYWSDLYHTWSTDGGATWKPVSILSGDKKTSESWGHTPQYLRYDATQNRYIADIVYLADLAPGVNPNSTGVATDNPIMYYAFTIPDVPTGVNDPIQTVRSFNLSQNYPNPFNPSTKIDYSLSAKSNVSLKIYDMLGREVANLVNATQEAGNHSINFNASKLASGMYVYTLRSGNNVMSKKLMLLK
ncbi:MAG: T9SS type A sorting domain-containing protein [Ignavibacteriaceae bacterium]|nr:T9SS type A sorting domain-containing protein [Ignavibacteriaceae bacterium]